MTSGAILFMLASPEIIRISQSGGLFLNIFQIKVENICKTGVLGRRYYVIDEK